MKSIYVLVATIPVLKATRGDMINAIFLCKAMSLFANVYYNNQLFVPRAKNYGLTHKKIVAPTRKYDFYYVRNNKAMFRRLPQPKVALAVPYDLEIFRSAAAIVAPTLVWKHDLMKHVLRLKKNLYFHAIVSPKRAICFPQAYDTIFKPLQQHPQTVKIRKSLKADFVIGCFGRITETCFPYSLLHILPKLRALHKKKRIVVIFAGPMKTKKPLRGVKYLGHLPHKSMPYYMSACDITSSNQRHPNTHHAGSRHVLESIACDVPVLSGKYLSRMEMLGAKYPLFWTFYANKGRLPAKSEQEMLTLLDRYITDPAFREVCLAHCRKRAPEYSMNKVAYRIRKEIEKFTR